MTPMEAFQLLTSSEYLENLSEKERNKIRVYKYRLRKGTKVNLDTVLENNGFIKVKEAEWKRKGIEK